MVEAQTTGDTEAQGQSTGNKVSDLLRKLLADDNVKELARNFLSSTAKKTKRANCAEPFVPIPSNEEVTVDKCKTSADNQNLFFFAATEHDIAAVTNFILNYSCDPQQKDQNGNSALQYLFGDTNTTPTHETHPEYTDKEIAELKQAVNDYEKARNAEKKQAFYVTIFKFILGILALIPIIGNFVKQCDVLVQNADLFFTLLQTKQKESPFINVEESGEQHQEEPATKQEVAEEPENEEPSTTLEAGQKDSAQAEMDSIASPA